MPYRIEISPNKRAGCRNGKCLKEKIKIEKDHIRMGTWVTMMEHGSWQWRHWGCVTPTQIANINIDCDHKPENLDGFDELPDDTKVKVRRAFKQGHVDDIDFKGDLEMNRPGKKSVRASKSKSTDGHKQDSNNNTSSKKKKRKKPSSNDEGEEAYTILESSDQDDNTPSPAQPHARDLNQRTNKKQKTAAHSRSKKIIPIDRPQSHSSDCQLSENELEKSNIRKDKKKKKKIISKKESN